MVFSKWRLFLLWNINYAKKCDPTMKESDNKKDCLTKNINLIDNHITLPGHWNNAINTYSLLTNINFHSFTFWPCSFNSLYFNSIIPVLPFCYFFSLVLSHIPFLLQKMFSFKH